jgi:uncharacterized membrane protein YcaP (DUF421 family)
MVLNMLRQLKISNTVMFDYLGTIMSAFIISYYTKVPVVISTICLFLLGELVHYFFNIKTNSLMYLGVV